MSCFSGSFPSLPGVRCDRFDRINESSGCTISDQFFLSHCHTDHMHGFNELASFLHRKSLGHRLNHKLYCSSISKAFILNKFKSRIPARAIVELQPNQPTTVHVYDSKEIYNLRITAIGANHCPGSVMFLFERLDEEGNIIKRILYTGDFRFDDSALSQLHSLHDRSGQPLPLDEMYLDTTFCSPHYKSFPTRREAESKIWDQCDKWIRRNGLLRNTRGKHVILLHLPARYGYERILKSIHEQSRKNWRVHVNKDKYNEYMCKEELMNCTESNPELAPWIHACTLSKKKERNHNKPLLKSLPCQTAELEVCQIRPCAMYFKTDKMESLERAGSDAIMSVTQGGNNYRVCYSCHSSLEELKTFVQYFLPKRIIPCAIPSSSSREEVAKILLSFLNPEKKDEEEEEDPNQSQIISNQVQQFTEFSQVNVPPRDSGSEFDSFDWFNDLSEKKNIENKNTSAEKFRISFDNTVTINLRRDGGESTDDEIEDFDERMEENEEKEEKRRNLVVGSWSSIEIIPGIIQESSDCEAEVNICTITPTSFKGEEVFSETTKVSSLSRRKKFARSKTDKTYYSMPVHPDTEMEANHPKERRSSMPSNMKLPLIKVTPSSPSIDFNHPDYPEFFQDKLYLEHVGKPLSGGKKGEGCNDGRSREGSRDSELNLKLSEDTDENSSLDHPACSADATSSYPAAATPAYPAADTLTSGCITSSCASAPASVCLAPTVPVSTAASPPTGHASVSPVCEKDNDLDSPNDVRRFKRQLSVFNQPEEDDCLIYKKQKVYDGVQGPNSSPNTREDQTVNSNNQGNSANINLLESQNIFETDESQDMFLQKSQDILQESQDMFNPKESQDMFNSQESQDMFNSQESQDMFNSQESQDMFNSQESQDILNDPISPDARYLVKSQTKQMQDSRDVIIIDDSQETTQVQESQVILDLNYSHESTENLLDGKECLKRKPDANLNHDTFEPKKKQKKDSNVKYNPEQLDSSTHPVEIIHNTVELESLNDLNDMENKEVNQKEAKNMKEDHDDKDEHEDGKEDDEDDKDPPDLDFLLREAEEKNYPEHVMRNLRYMDECRKNIIQID